MTNTAKKHRLYEEGSSTKGQKGGEWRRGLFSGPFIMYMVWDSVQGSVVLRRVLQLPVTAYVVAISRNFSP
jgi:hypothetical protein